MLIDVDSRLSMLSMLSRMIWMIWMPCSLHVLQRGLLLCRPGQLGRRSLGVFKSQIVSVLLDLADGFPATNLRFPSHSQVPSSQGEFSSLLVSTSAREIGGMLLKTECLAKCETRNRHSKLDETEVTRQPLQGVNKRCYSHPGLSTPESYSAPSARLLKASLDQSSRWLDCCDLDSIRLRMVRLRATEVQHAKIVISETSLDLPSVLRSKSWMIRAPIRMFAFS